MAADRIAAGNQANRAEVYSSRRQFRSAQCAHRQVTTHPLARVWSFPDRSTGAGRRPLGLGNSAQDLIARLCNYGENAGDGDAPPASRLAFPMEVF